jgi:hypothetical protein
MSFDVYVQRFRRGEKEGIALRYVRDAFPGLIKVIDEDYWKLIFSNADSTDLFLQPLQENGEKIHALSFHRPCADGRLWQGIWDLLADEGSVFHYPGCSSALARHITAIDHLPADMGGLGIALATGPQDLARCLAEFDESDD